VLLFSIIRSGSYFKKTKKSQVYVQKARRTKLMFGEETSPSTTESSNEGTYEHLVCSRALMKENWCGSNRNADVFMFERASSRRMA